MREATTREDVLREFPHRDPARHGLRLHRLADEIVRLRAEAEAMRGVVTEVRVLAALIRRDRESRWVEQLEEAIADQTELVCEMAEALDHAAGGGA